jgi:2'-5' RNA ligase
VRLFTGIALPAEVIERLKRLLDHLRPAAHLRWVAPYNLHVTTKFIGEWPETRLEELMAVLQKLGNRAPFEIGVSGIGWLPNPHAPRVLFVGIKAGNELADLARATDDETAALGIARENRAFKPHLTLARIKDTAVPLSPLRHAIAGIESTAFGVFPAQAFHLYLSKPGPAGSIYTQLAEFRFTG